MQPFKSGHCGIRYEIQGGSQEIIVMIGDGTIKVIWCRIETKTEGATQIHHQNCY